MSTELNQPWYERAIAGVDRRHFVNNSQADLVVGRSIPPKDLVARSLALLTLPEKARVLHLGAGVGYATATGDADFGIDPLAEAASADASGWGADV